MMSEPRLTLSAMAQVDGRAVLVGLTFAPTGQAHGPISVQPQAQHWYEAIRLVQGLMVEGGAVDLPSRAAALARTAGLRGAVADAAADIAQAVEGMQARYGDAARMAYEVLTQAGASHGAA